MRDLLINAATIKKNSTRQPPTRNLLNSVNSLEGEEEGVPLEGREEIAGALEENLRQSEQAARMPSRSSQALR